MKKRILSMVFVMAIAVLFGACTSKKGRESQSNTSSGTIVTGSTAASQPSGDSASVIEGTTGHAGQVKQTNATGAVDAEDKIDMMDKVSNNLCG